jgi:hypothetical protein
LFDASLISSEPISAGVDAIRAFGVFIIDDEQVGLGIALEQLKVEFVRGFFAGFQPVIGPKSLGDAPSSQH